MKKVVKMSHSQREDKTHHRMLSLFFTLGRDAAQRRMPIQQLIRCRGQLLLPGASNSAWFSGNKYIALYDLPKMPLCLHDMRWNGVLKGIKEFRSGRYQEGGKGGHTQHICFISDANAVMVQANPDQSSWHWMHGFSERKRDREIKFLFLWKKPTFRCHLYLIDSYILAFRE